MVLFLCGCKYPEGDAGSVRVHALAKLMELCGKKPVVIGKGHIGSKEKSNYDGIDFYSFKYNKDNFLGKVADRLSYTSRVKCFLKKFGQEFSHIVIVDIPFSAIQYTKKYAAANQIQLIHDSVEWYSSSQFRFGRFNPMYIHRDRLNRKIIDPDFRVIAISKYLEEYFLQKGCQTIRIPAILTTTNPMTEKKVSGKWIITYAGLPEKKDKLIEILESYTSLDKNQKDMIELRVVGVTLPALAKRFGLSSETVARFKDIQFFQRLPRKEVLKKLNETHFTIFYRNSNERYAKAGFPTKVAESTSMGIPVITNLSSDLNLYLRNMENSIIIDESADGIKNAFGRVCSLSVDEYKNMCRKSMEIYSRSFYYSIYQTALKAFIS